LRGNEFTTEAQRGEAFDLAYAEVCNLIVLEARAVWRYRPAPGERLQTTARLAIQW
jgi:hypothetical protein